MRAIYRVGWALFLSVTAMASNYGNPDQDSVVKALQTDFSNGSIPAEADLAYGKWWDCTSFSAVTDNWSTQTFTMHLDHIGPYIVRSDLGDVRSGAPAWMLNKDGLLVHYIQNENVDPAYAQEGRKVANGILVFERANLGQSLAGKAPAAVSKAASGGFVDQYIRCVLEKQ